MKRAKSSGRETRSKSKARERNFSPESDLENEKSGENLPEQTIRSSSRMSRRDSYEQTMLQKSTEKSRSRSSRSMSRRKSKNVTEENEIEQNIQEEQSHNKAEAQKKGNESEKRRKSKRNKAEKEEANNENEVDTAGNREDNIRKDCESEKEVASIEEPMCRDKSERTTAKGISSHDDEVSPENILETHHQDKKSVKRPTRKSKRFAVEEDVEISEAVVKAVENSGETVVSKTRNGDRINEIQSETEGEVETEQIVQRDKEHKRKSRRIANALNVPEDTVDTEPVSSTVSEKEGSVNHENNSNVLKMPEKERRGTFVVNKVAIHADTEAEEMIGKEKRNRRGTFVVPTAPPPAPKTKKTISNIPILEGRGKAAEEKETKRKLEKDRRGTYFVPKPVTPYLDVENIEDIEADSLLVSLTDDDSQSLLLSRDKEEKSQKETEGEDALKTAVPSKMPSPTPYLGETTVLEPQDMELTEALPGVSWSRFSAPEPDFLKNISPGPAPLTRPIDRNKTVTLEKSKEHLAESQIAPDKSNSEDYVSESDFEEEKEKSKERKKPTKINNKEKTTDIKLVKESDKAEKTNKNQLETAIEDAHGESSDKEVRTDTARPKRARSKKFKLMKAADNGLGPSDTESVTSEIVVSEVSAQPKTKEQVKRLFDSTVIRFHETTKVQRLMWMIPFKSLQISLRNLMLEL